METSGTSFGRVFVVRTSTKQPGSKVRMSICSAHFHQAARIKGTGLFYVTVFFQSALSCYISLFYVMGNGYYWENFMVCIFIVRAGLF